MNSNRFLRPLVERAGKGYILFGSNHNGNRKKASRELFLGLSRSPIDEKYMTRIDREFHAVPFACRFDAV